MLQLEALAWERLVRSLPDAYEPPSDSGSSSQRPSAEDDRRRRRRPNEYAAAVELGVRKPRSASARMSVPPR